MNVAMFDGMPSFEADDRKLSPLAVLPATSHTAVIGQADLLYAVIEPFLMGKVPKGMF